MNTKTGSNTKSAEKDSSDILHAVVAIAAIVAPDLDLAAKDDSEGAGDHAHRLLVAMKEPAEELANELEQTKRSLSAQKGAATKARNELEAVEAQLPPRPRKYEDFGDAKRPETDAMLEALEDAEQIQLVFLDEKGTEISGLAPRNLTAKAFRRDRFGRLAMKVDSMTVQGPQAGSPYRLAGYALETDGKLLVHGPRFDGVLLISPGASYELKSDVVL